MFRPQKELPERFRVQLRERGLSWSCLQLAMKSVYTYKLADETRIIENPNLYAEDRGTSPGFIIVPKDFPLPRGCKEIPDLFGRLDEWLRECEKKKEAARKAKETRKKKARQRSLKGS